MRKSIQYGLIFISGVILTIIVIAILSNLCSPDISGSYYPTYDKSTVTSSVPESSTYDMIYSHSNYVLKNTYVSIYNDDVSGTGNGIIKTVYDYGGQVLHSEFHDYTNYQSFDIKVRVPYSKSDEFDNYLKKFKILGWNENVYVIDEQVNDLNNTIQNLKAKIELYEEYYNKTNNLNTKLQLLDKIQTLKSQLNYYEKLLHKTINQTNYVTYDIHVTNYKTYKMKSVTIDFTEIMYNIKLIYVWLIELFIYLLFTVIPIGLVIYFIYKKYMKKE